jgi:hypothetical protein
VSTRAAALEPAQSAGTGLPARPDRLQDLPLAVAVAVELLVLALLPRVVTVDGPAHVAGGWALAHAGDPVVSRLYEIDLQALPNLLATFLLAGLLTVVGPDAAEKLLVAGYAVLLPLALRYALRGVDPRAGWLAVVAVPFTGSYLFFYGFYNFCLGLALALVVAGVALRRRDGWTAWPVAGLAAAVLLTWAAHLLPALVAAVLVAVLALTRVAHDRTGGLGPALRRHLLPVVVAGLPVLGLTLAFAGSDAAARGPAEHRPLLDLVLGLIGLGRPLVVYAVAEYAVAAVLALVLLGLAWQRHPPSPERRALGLTTVLATVAYLASPNRFGPEYGFLNDRLSLFPPLLLLLWAAGPPPSRTTRRAVVAAVLGVGLALALLRVPTETRYQRDVAELLSVAPAVPRGSTLVRLQLWRPEPAGGPVAGRNRFRDPLRHQTSRLAVLAGSVDAGHYEAVLPYFPVRFRPGLDPRRALDPTLRELDRVPPGIDLAAARELVDVVIVLGRRRASEQVLASPQAQRALADLTASYRLAATSTRSGLAEVWVRRS